MKQLNFADWFDENHKFKGDTVLPEGLTVDSMWQAMSMFPLEEDFIIANIKELDLPLLCMNGLITKRVLSEVLPSILWMLVEDPEIIEDVILYILELTDSEAYSDAERVSIARKLLVSTNAQWDYLLTAKATNPVETIQGSLQALDKLVHCIVAAYIEEIVRIDGLSIFSIYPGIRVLYMMVNVYYDLDTVNWSDITADDIDDAIETCYPILSPMAHPVIGRHMTDFIRLAIDQELKYEEEIEEEEE